MRKERRIVAAGRVGFVLVAGLVLFAVLDTGAAWWLALVIVFLPDVSFAAYLARSRIGATADNLVRVYAAGAGLLAPGLWLGAGALAGIGALWLAHSGFDLILGLRSQGANRRSGHASWSHRQMMRPH